MNKKGVDGIKLSLYFAGELAAGVFIVVLLLIFIPRSMTGSVEEVMAKDISLTIMAMSASSYDMSMQYEKNTENYEIKITDDEVQVKSKKGSGKYKYLPMRGIQVQNAVLENTLSIPLNLKDSAIYFKDDQTDFTDFCSEIPVNFDENVLKIKIEIEQDETETTKESLELLKNTILLRAKTAASPGKKIMQTEYDEDLLIVLGTSSGDIVKVKYYGNPEEPESSLYHRTACYTEKLIEDNMGTQFKNMQIEQFSEQKKIAIDFGDPSKINKSAVNQLSENIYRSLVLGLND